jgi:hypothetical protein
MPERFRVEPNPVGGFYVVEHTPEGDIPRGWTYETGEEAEAAIPQVAAGDHYPKVVRAPGRELSDPVSVRAWVKPR